MGNAVCVSIAPTAFLIDDEGYAEVVVEHPDGDLVELVARAARQCPTNAIFLDVE